MMSAAKHPPNVGPVFTVATFANTADADDGRPLPPLPDSAYADDATSLDQVADDATPMLTTDDGSDGDDTHVYELLDRDEVPLVVRGRLLGFASSQRDEHSHDPDHDYADRGERCAACRWLEVRIFHVTGELPNPEVLHNHDDDADDDDDDDDDGDELDQDEVFDEPRARYLVLTYGITIVPGEIVRHRAAWTDSAFEITTLLSQRRNEQTFIPLTSQRALAQAASRDLAVRDAFINRAGSAEGRRP
jgi:hypothetical protein